MSYQIRNPVEAFRSQRGKSRYSWPEVSAILVLLALNAALNLWNLSTNGWANAYYSAAVQSGLHNREALIFGSSDWGNSISVDKPPLSLWLMGLSVRLLGFNSWGLLLPQALLGLATTFLIWAVARRYLTSGAALASAGVFALTPVIVLISRYNNPDPLLLFLMLASLAAVLRAAESGRLQWVALGGVLLGLAVLTKQLQALLVAPGILAAMLTVCWGQLRRTVRWTVTYLIPLIITASSWFLLVQLIPTQNRPYIGGSTDNGVLSLTFGYNGISRIISEDDPVATLIPAQYRGNSGSDAGLLRLLNANYGQEAGWLLPVAVVAVPLVMIGLLKTCRRSSRALMLASLVWFLTTYLMLSFMGNQIHTYYTSALAPPLALLLGCAVHSVMVLESHRTVRLLAGGGILLGTLTAWALLNGIADWPREAALPVLISGIASTALVAVRPPSPMLNRVAAASATLALLLGPGALSLHVAQTPQTGSNPLAAAASSNPTSIGSFLREVKAGNPSWARDMALGHVPSGELANLIRQSNRSCTWGAATLPAQSAAQLQLASRRAVLPLGGFSSTDPWPTLSEFRSWVSNGNICYLVDAPDMDVALSHSSAAWQIIQWIRSTYSATVIDGYPVYKLS